MKTKIIDIDNIPEENNRRPRSLEEVAIRAKVNNRETAYLREFMDEFYSQDDPNILFKMIEKEPVLTDEPKINAYYAAVAEHLAYKYKLKIPSWVNNKERFLHRAHFPCGLESLKALYLMESPVAFRRRMIFVEAEPLYRPRKDSLGISD